MVGTEKPGQTNICTRLTPSNAVNKRGAAVQSNEEILETLRQGRLAHPQYLADALAAERDMADRAETALAEAWYDGFDAGSRSPHQKTRENPHIKSEATA
jgi:hypothetical protein